LRSPEKRTSYSHSCRVSGPGWSKHGGKNHLNSKGFGGLQERCISAVFLQKGLFLGVFSTGTETDGFTGFSGNALGYPGGKRALNRAYLLPGLKPPDFRPLLRCENDSGELILSNLRQPNDPDPICRVVTVSKI